jgi:hypothetical protein
MYYLWNAEKPLHDAPRINYLQALLAHPYWNRPSRPSLLVDLCLVSVSAQEFFSKKTALPSVSNGDEGGTVGVRVRSKLYS